MINRRRRGIDHFPVWLCIAIVLSIIAPIAWWALRPLPAFPPWAAAVADVDTPTHAGNRANDASFPPAALTVTLRDALFDTPPAPAASPPPPPRLDLELIAITGSGGDRAAFVHAPNSGEYMELRPGETTAQSATVIEIGDTFVLLRLGERDIRLELAP